MRGSSKRRTAARSRPVRGVLRRQRRGGELGGDTAQLSLDQARVQSLAAQVNALPEVRQEKVAALGQAVRDGRYQISPEQTAEAVISEMLARSAAA